MFVGILYTYIFFHENVKDFGDGENQKKGFLKKSKNG